MFLQSTARPSCSPRWAWGVPVRELEHNFRQGSVATITAWAGAGHLLSKQTLVPRSLVGSAPAVPQPRGLHTLRPEATALAADCRPRPVALGMRKHDQSLTADSGDTAVESAPGEVVDAQLVLELVEDGAHSQCQLEPRRNIDIRSGKPTLTRVTHE